ncbi:MAG: glycoside hydrolase family 28 protein, partial [Lachnospiraceae bacterium]|nr:glycoside hydrolase family 28 protein [Lachnospiraceae bacterium]
HEKWLSNLSLFKEYISVNNCFPTNTTIYKEFNLGSWEGDPLDQFASIITGIGIENAKIIGKGVVDGNAHNGDWWFEHRKKRIAWRPNGVFLNNCKNVVVHGITVQNSPSWNIHPYFSQDLRFIGISVLGPQDSPNTDGLDPESCKNVDIIGVYFSVGDDCIAIKSGKIYMGAKYKTPSENLTIRQCCMRDGHGAITIGSEMAGGVKNLNVENCLFLHTDRGLRIKTRRGRGKDAIVTGIKFENIIMDHVKTPVVMNSFYFCDWDGHSEYVQSKEFQPVDERTPYLGDFMFKNLEATNCHAAASYMYGLPEQKIHHVIFENANFSFTENPTPFVPAMMDGVDEQTNTGIFAKNIETFELRNVTVTGQIGDEVITEGIDSYIK